MKRPKTLQVGDAFAAIGLALIRDSVNGYYVRLGPHAEDRRVLRLRSIEQAELLLEWFAPRVLRPALKIEQWKSYPVPIWSQREPNEVNGS